MRERKDFVLVRLSAAGRAFAGEGAMLRVATARMHYLFEGAEPVEVLVHAEWKHLQHDLDPEGNPLFELAPIAPAEGSEEV